MKEGYLKSKIKDAVTSTTSKAKDVVGRVANALEVTQEDLEKAGVDTSKLGEATSSKYYSQGNS